MYSKWFWVMESVWDQSAACIYLQFDDLGLPGWRLTKKKKKKNWEERRHTVVEGKWQMEIINVDGFSLPFLRILQHSLLFDSGTPNFLCSLAIPFTCSCRDKTAAASTASFDECSSCKVCVATNRFSVSTILRQGGVEHNSCPNSKHTAVKLMDMLQQKQMLPWQTRATLFIWAV